MPCSYRRLCDINRLTGLNVSVLTFSDRFRSSLTSSADRSPELALPFFGSLAGFLSTCQSGPSYCGNCFEKVNDYNGVCNDSPQIRMFIQDHVSIVPKEQKAVDVAHDTKESELGDNQKGSESWVDETVGTSKKPTSIAAPDLDAIAPVKPTDGNLLAESTPSNSEHGGTEDTLLASGASSGVESGKEDHGTKSTSSNLNSPGNENTLSTDDDNLMSTK